MRPSQGEGRDGTAHPVSPFAARLRSAALAVAVLLTLIAGVALLKAVGSAARAGALLAYVFLHGMAQLVPYAAALAAAHVTTETLRATVTVTLMGC